MSVPRRALLVALLAAPAAACSMHADPIPDRLRGTVTKVVGSYIWIRIPDGRTLLVGVATDAGLDYVVPAAFSDIHKNSYIGAIATEQPDGTLRARVVLVYPEAMRGNSPGTHPWDTPPGSAITNATVTKVSGVDGRTLTLLYYGGEKTVVVQPDVPIVTYMPAKAAALVPGVHVIAAVKPSTDGMLNARRVVIGANGMTPPM